MLNPTTHAVLGCHDLRQVYGPTVALSRVSLAVREGEAVAVMGPSGSGKTTLLHCLAAILRPGSGEVTAHLPRGEVRVGTLDDEARAELRRRHFGFVFQQGLLLPELTALENAALPLMLAGAKRGEAEEQARAWLAQLGLAGAEDKRTGELSGGMAQRVAIARSQVTGPTVTFADEPTGALDRRTSGDVLSALLHATVGRGRTLVVVTHDEQVAARCQRVVTLEDGQVVHDTRPTVPFGSVPAAAPGWADGATGQASAPSEPGQAAGQPIAGVVVGGWA